MLASGHEAFADIVNCLLALQLPLGKQLQDSVKKPRPRKMSTGSPLPGEQENEVDAWNAKFNIPKDEKFIQSKLSSTKD